MIQVKDLVKQFGPRRAVDGVSFGVCRGEVLGFLGPNGAGKTTTMRMITGFLPPTAGTAVVNGRDVVEDPVAARTAIGYLPENAPSYPDMTVQAFLRFMAEMRGYSGTERNRRADEAMERCLLSPVRHQTVDTLSKGYRQRTCFAQAILHDPPILILDEPTEGLDPNQKQVVRDMIRAMRQDKVIIFSTHILEEVDAVCSRAIIISKGRVVADEAPAQLKKKYGRLDDAFRALTTSEDVTR
jgi:ABC-2 type transport system ATP-binding protein